MKVTLVNQTHKYGCSIACAAMVLNEEYDDLIKEFGNNFHKGGIDEETLVDFISDRGYSIIEKKVTVYSKKEFGREELLKPFAPIHIVRVRATADASLQHWVVMDKKGKLICPMEWTDKEVRESYRIMRTVGIYKD